MNFCTHCGKKLGSPNAKFCGECGMPVASSEAASPDRPMTEKPLPPPPTDYARPILDVDEPEEVQPAKLNVNDLGIKLEDTAASILEKMGYNVLKRQKPPTLSEATAEIDLVISRGNRKKAVECKNYDPSRSIGVSLLRVFKDKLADAGFASGLFVTNTYFSEDAVKLAESTGIELWDGDALREKFFAYSIGRIRNPSLVSDPVLPLQQDYTTASAIPLKNLHAVNLFSSILFYHPYIVVKYRVQAIRNDPTGKHHTITDSGSYIVDALDGDIINKEQSLLNNVVGGLFKSKEQRMESKEDKIVSEDLLSINPVSQTVMRTTDYDVTVAEASITEEEAIKIIKALAIEKNTQDVDYKIKIRGEWETRSLRVVPKQKEVSIRGQKLVYVPKWDLQYESGQRNFEKRSIASSGREVTNTFARCEACALLKKSPIVLCESCGMLLCEKHSYQEAGKWLCKNHISDSSKEEAKGKGFLSKLGIS